MRFSQYFFLLSTGTLIDATFDSHHRAYRHLHRARDISNTAAATSSSTQTAAPTSVLPKSIASTNSIAIASPSSRAENVIAQVKQAQLDTSPREAVHVSSEGTLEEGDIESEEEVAATTSTTSTPSHSAIHRGKPIRHTGQRKVISKQKQKLKQKLKPKKHPKKPVPKKHKPTFNKPSTTTTTTTRKPIGKGKKPHPTKSHTTIVIAPTTTKATTAAVTTQAISSTLGQATAPAPAPTGAGTVAGCTEWYTAVSGDYCYLIAQKIDLNVNVFMQWNPSVNAPACNTLYAGFAYCVATTVPVVSSPAAATSTVSTLSASNATWSAGYTAPASTATSAAAANPSANANGYVMYSGDGTVAQGWPAKSAWATFETMWAYNVPIMQQSCNNWGVADDSATEIGYIKSSILSVSQSTGIDPRFILAIAMQESNGCVRVITTSWSVQNPGLMQSHDGAGSCNRGGTVQNPCPESEILQMIQDGTEGTSSGDGLQQCLKETGVSDVSMYYKAARIYNGGLGGYNANNLGSGCCTLCYSSDVANRLMGWHVGNSGCTL